MASILRLGLDDEMHVRVLLVCMQRHDVTVLRPKLLAGEVARRSQDRFGRSGRGHRQHYVVYELAPPSPTVRISGGPVLAGG
jgi:hypothetical protein